MSRVIVYVDGFNLYHAIDALRRPPLKWLDLAALGKSLLREGEQLAQVKYFSAFATWMPESFARHRLYVAALKATAVSVHMAKFKKKPRSCYTCGARWIGHEEKETDVQIALHMLADAFGHQAERLIVISADTDLAPAMRMIREKVPSVEVFFAAPPGRFDICRALDPKIELTSSRLAKNLLPPVVIGLRGQTIARPESYGT